MDEQYMKLRCEKCKEVLASVNNQMDDEKFLYIGGYCEKCKDYVKAMVTTRANKQSD